MGKSTKKELKEEKDENKIPLEKIVTKEEMNSLIKVLKLRQCFFQKISEERKLASEKAKSSIKEKFNGLASKELEERMITLTEKLMDKADEVFLEPYQEELKNQPGVVEFLHRFTNEKFETYSLNLK